MKIKKEYGEQVFKIMYERCESCVALDDIFSMVDENLLDVFVEVHKSPFWAIDAMYRFARSGYTYPYSEFKKAFFNKYVEGGYQEPLYYVKDEFTDQCLFGALTLYSGITYPKWFNRLQASKFRGPVNLMKHTKQEWLDINPAYEKMLVEVEE